MKFCRNCGAQIDDNAIFCQNCGSRTNGDNPRGAYGFNPYDRGGYFGYNDRESWPIAILSFCVWQIGVLIWLFSRHTRPGRARSALKGTLGGACFSFPVMGLVLWLLWRRDYSHEDLAKIAGVSAIVGACVASVISAVLLILSYAGGIQLPEISPDTFAGADAIFCFFKRF